jgi:hypothetical protein
MLLNTKKPTGLPYGSGSLQIRGRVWWMIYKDGEGQTIQESAKTQDWDEAVRLLAARALPIAWARVEALLEAARLPEHESAEALVRHVFMEVEQERIADEKAARGKGARAARRDSRGRTGAGIAAGRRRSGAIPAGRSSKTKKGGQQ